MKGDDVELILSHEVRWGRVQLLRPYQKVSGESDSRDLTTRVGCAALASNGYLIISGTS